MSTASKPIPVVSIGVSRSVGFRLIEPLFEGTPYQFTAFVDLKTSEESVKYNAHNLAVVLNALNPRPQALIVGNAVDVSVADEAEPVWRHYVKSVLKKDDGGHVLSTAFVAMPRTEYHNPGGTGKPPSGWDIELMGQLDAEFRPERMQMSE